MFTEYITEAGVLLVLSGVFIVIGLLQLRRLGYALFSSQAALSREAEAQRIGMAVLGGPPPSSQAVGVKRLVVLVYLQGQCHVCRLWVSSDQSELLPALVAKTAQQLFGRALVNQAEGKVVDEASRQV